MSFYLVTVYLLKDLFEVKVLFMANWKLTFEFSV